MEERAKAPNLVIAEKGTGRILHVIEDCRRVGRRYVGTNKSVAGVREDLVQLKWTYEDLHPLATRKARAIHSRAFDAIAEVPPPKRIGSVFAGMTEKEVEEYIDRYGRDLDGIRHCLAELVKLVGDTHA